MTMLDHVGFAVADYERSKAFYEKALAPLGLRLLMEFSEASAGFGRLGAVGAPRLPQDRAHVDAFHVAALEAGGIDNGAPGIRWYHPDYYGGYVLDPDGNNIEAVCHKPG